WPVAASTGGCARTARAAGRPIPEQGRVDRVNPPTPRHSRPPPGGQPPRQQPPRDPRDPRYGRPSEPPPPPVTRRDGTPVAPRPGGRGDVPQPPRPVSPDEEGTRPVRRRMPPASGQPPRRGPAGRGVPPRRQPAAGQPPRPAGSGGQPAQRRVPGGPPGRGGRPPLRPPQRTQRLAAGPQWPTTDPDELRPFEVTTMLPRISAASQTGFLRSVDAGPETGLIAAVEKEPSLARSTGKIAIASLTSRITGFLWKIMLVWVVGIGVVNGSFNVANTLPNIVYELLLGGVLASVVVPLLVRAQDDPDGGEAYTQRLLTMALTLLGGATVVAVLAAPWFTALYVDSSTNQANPELTTAFAYLLLPQILFYGIFALLMAILNAKQIFGPPAWAPVVNNLVVIATILVFAMVPGEISLDPVRMGDIKRLVLGVGVTLGIVAQAAMLVPPL